jgi:hypothetical protein
MEEVSMRKVRIMEFEYNPETRKMEKRETDKFGLFHQWGTDFEELGETGVGNYTTAVIERGDGTIETPHANLIQFID